MSNKWSTITAPDGELYLSVNEVCEISYTVLEDVVDNLQDSRGMLDESDLWTLVHFESTINKAILWLEPQVSKNLKLWHNGPGIWYHNHFEQAGTCNGDLVCHAEDKST